MPCTAMDALSAEHTRAVFTVPESGKWFILYQPCQLANPSIQCIQKPE